VLRAIASERVDVMGHPSARKLGVRPEIELDWEAVFAAAREHGVALEVNSLPQRLDLDGDVVRSALEAGVSLAISTDAHSTGELEALERGIGQARRGWAEPRHVINALDLPSLRARLSRHHPHARRA
jgi:DNA polymerase (family 10)